MDQSLAARCLAIAAALDGETELLPDSMCEVNGTLAFVARLDGDRWLIVSGDGMASFDGAPFVCDGQTAKRCALSVANANALMAHFPFTRPCSHKGHPCTLGLGDRLGLASSGHIRAVRGRGVFPVLAQQSMRELTLTGRTYPEVIASAAFAVFEQGWREGWGADGDHLKEARDIQSALDAGCTMITLDCSDHIDNGVSSMQGAQVDAAYDALSAARRERYAPYFGALHAGDLVMNPTPIQIKRIALTYDGAIDHAINIYRDIIAPCGHDIDFEMSIDETATPTDPAAHFVVASELIRGGVRITSLAPRFCGEFQKGIDYVGDIDQFEREFAEHVQIAGHFGYKISVHSGSDKFAVYPIIGALTGGNVHIKTAGTNWLEAMRVIAQKRPDLYRRMHKYALAHFDEARAYYVVSTNVDNIPRIDALRDAQLPGCLDNDDERQLIHITYGLLLQAKDKDGTALFRDEFFAALDEQANAYSAALIGHIGKHLALIGK